MRNFEPLDLEDVQEHFDWIKGLYPTHAAQAREMIIKYLKQYDVNRLDAFLGYDIPDVDYFDRAMIRIDLEETQQLICELLLEKENNNSNVTSAVIDRTVRAALRIPFAVIEGGKASV